MTSALRQVLWTSRLIATRRSWWLASAAGLVVSLSQVHSWSTNPILPFGASDGLAATAEVMRLLLPALAGMAAAIWVGELSRADRLRDGYLARTAPRREVWLACIAAALVCLGVSLGLAVVSLAAGQLWSHPAQPIAGAGTPPPDIRQLQERWLLLGLLPFVWALIGATLGRIARSGVAAASATAGTAVVSLIMERAATTYPTVADLETLTPLGASTALVLGETVPNMPSSRAPVAGAAAVLIFWCVLCAIYVSRTGWSRLLDDEAGGSEPSQRARLRVAVASTATLALAMGFVVPSALSTRIPWRYKSDWRQMVADHRSPADQVSFVLAALAEGDMQTVGKVTAEPAVPALTSLRPQLEQAGGSPRISNVLDAEEPGSVVVDIGDDTRNADGSLTVAPQIGLCLRRRHAVWVIVTVSESGVTCS